MRWRRSVVAAGAGSSRPASLGAVLFRRLADSSSTSVARCRQRSRSATTLAGRAGDGRATQDKRPPAKTGRFSPGSRPTPNATAAMHRDRRSRPHFTAALTASGGAISSLQGSPPFQIGSPPFRIGSPLFRIGVQTPVVQNHTLKERPVNPPLSGGNHPLPNRDIRIRECMP